MVRAVGMSEGPSVRSYDSHPPLSPRPIHVVLSLNPLTWGDYLILSRGLYELWSTSPRQFIVPMRQMDPRVRPHNNMSELTYDDLVTVYREDFDPYRTLCEVGQVLAGPASVIPATGAVVVKVGKCIYNAIRAIYLRRRAVIEACKEDLVALNSPSLVRLPMDDVPSCSSALERRGLQPEQHVSEDVVTKRHNHRMFVAKWARAAKGRFLFAQMCEDTTLNRAALQRWFLAQWKEVGLTLVQIDLFMLECIDLAFEPTLEFQTRMTKRQMKRYARMEYYNERKFLQVAK